MTGIRCVGFAQAVCLVLAAAGASEAGLQIGSDRQVFVDRFLISEMRGLSLELHAPVPREVAIAFDRPWEGNTSCLASVMKDGSRFRMWYRVSAGNQDSEAMTAYAESRDGIRWEKPSLGLMAFRGSKDNNLVWPPEGVHGRNMCVFKDPNPGVPEGERYKAIVHSNAIYGLVSADGLRWRPVAPEPLIAPIKEEAHSDGPHTVFWDPWQRKYVIYRRGWWGENRTIRRSTSADFRKWSAPEFVDIVFGASPREQFYTNSCTPYDRAPGVYFMFPKRFVEERTFFPEWPFPGQSDIGFLSSRDGIHWGRTFREAWIRPGLDPKNWHERSMEFGWGIVPTGPAELSMYMDEHVRTDAAHIRRVTIRPDGFVSVHAGYDGGDLITRPLVFTGRRLSLNYSTSASGSVRVELLNSFGRPVAGFGAAESQEIFGDELERTVTWAGKSDAGALAGQPVRLRFLLRDADLYSFRFTE